MKKFSIALASALVLGLSFTSCSSDDNGGGVTAEKLAGKWEFSKQKYSVGGQALPEEDYDDNEVGCAKDYIIFNENGTYEEGDYWSSECTLDTWDGAYTLDGKTITVDGQDVIVQTLSGTTLKLKTSYSEEGVAYTVVMTLKKAAN